MTKTAHQILKQTFNGTQVHQAIASGALISPGAYLGNNITVYPGVEVADRCMILDGAVLGRPPIANASITRQVSPEFKSLKIGAGTIVGCNAVIYTDCEIAEDVLIGDQASIREGCKIGERSIIGRSVMLQYNTVIGARTRIQDHAQITGNSILEDDVFVAMGVMMANDNHVYLNRFGMGDGNYKGATVRRFAVIGTGAVILPELEIGEGALVAAGAVVTKDVPAWTVVAGVPARAVKEIPEEWKQVILSRVRSTTANDR